jgi:hypothetical protein
MPHPHPSLGAFAVAFLLLGTGAPAAAERLFALSEDGRTFEYRARPGDHPTAVALMFGLGDEDIPAFLAANGITDPTRVGAGFVYRVPNRAVDALAKRATALEGENARLTRDAREVTTRIRSLEREAREAHAGAAAAEAQAARAERIQTLWPAAQAAVVGLLIVAVGALAIATAALRRQRRADRYARTLAAELEEKRRTGLAERQESSRRILDLEARVRTLEGQLGPRVLIGGRGS